MSACVPGDLEVNPFVAAAIARKCRMCKAEAGVLCTDPITGDALWKSGERWCHYMRAELS